MERRGEQLEGEGGGEACLVNNIGTNIEKLIEDLMHQSTPSSNIPPTGNPRDFAPTLSPGPGFVPPELPVGCQEVGPIIYYLKYRIDDNATEGGPNVI